MNGSTEQETRPAEHTMPDIWLTDAPGARAWLDAAGYDRPVRVSETLPPTSFSGVTVSGGPDSLGNKLSWRPTTFREVLARALALGAAVGCQKGMMSVIAAGEARLAALMERIGKTRQDDPATRPACVVTVDGRFMPGLWVPDLIDLAAGHHPVLKPGDEHAAQVPASMASDALVVDFEPDILIPGPHLYAAVEYIASQLYPNQIPPSP